MVMRCEDVPPASRDVQPPIRVQMNLRHDGRHLPQFDGRRLRGGVKNVGELDSVQAAGSEGGVGQAGWVGCGDEEVGAEGVEDGGADVAGVNHL